MNQQNKGKFITFEGGEGTGKTTQIEFIIQHIQDAGKKVIATREPGGSDGAELIRDLLVKGDVHRWDSVTEALLMTAARRDHLQTLILPAINEGTWVVCDRFVDSTTAYQGYGHGLDLKKLAQLYDFISPDFKPDLTFVFDLDPAIGLERARRRNDQEDRFENMDIEFHERLREGYRRIAQNDLGRYKIIDASLNRAKIANQIQELIQPYLI